MPDWEDWDLTLAQELEPPLGKAMIAGAGAAQESVIGITVNWSLSNPKAQEFLRKHALELAKTINKTTKDKLKSALLTGFKLGEGPDDLAKRVKAVMTDATDWRAQMVARSESMRAYNAGALQLYEESKVVKRKRWLAAPDSCVECLGLDDRVIDIGDLFDGGEFGQVMMPPLHQNCRCSLSGVVE